MRQLGGLEVEDLLSSEEEENEEDGMPGVTRVPQVQIGRRITTPQSSPTQQEKATEKDTFADLKLKVSSGFRCLVDRTDADESSEDEELCTDSLISHTTATNSTTIGNLSSPL